MTPDAGRAKLPVSVEDWRLESDDGEQLVLSDLINRVLDKGVVISGHVTISIADIDLIALDLRVLITSIQTAVARSGATSPRDD
jgi:gas vesicle structural protein